MSWNYHNLGSASSPTGTYGPQAGNQQRITVGSFPGSDIIWKNYREPPEEGAISQASTTLSCGPILLHILPCEIHSTKHEGVERGIHKSRGIESETERWKETEGSRKDSGGGL